MKFKLYYIQKMGIYKTLPIKTVMHLTVIGAIHSKIFVSRSTRSEIYTYFNLLPDIC